MRVLIVEDEMTIALLLEDIVVDLGHDVVELAMRLPQAIAVAEDADADFAILDVNLDGSLSFPVAEILARRGIPFVFATGYGAAGLDPRFQDRPLIGKPFVIRDIDAALRAAGARAA